MPAATSLIGGLTKAQLAGLIATKRWASSSNRYWEGEPEAFGTALVSVTSTEALALTNDEGFVALADIPGLIRDLPDSQRDELATLGCWAVLSALAFLIAVAAHDERSSSVTGLFLALAVRQFLNRLTALLSRA